MTAATARVLASVADLLESDEEAFDTAADAIMDSRNQGPRVIDPESGEPADRDVTLILSDLIAAFRGAGRAAA